MAERFKDMTGKVFGRLHVLRRAENDRYGNGGNGNEGDL